MNFIFIILFNIYIIIPQNFNKQAQGSFIDFL